MGNYWYHEIVWEISGICRGILLCRLFPIPVANKIRKLMAIIIIITMVIIITIIIIITMIIIMAMIIMMAMIMIMAIIIIITMAERSDG